MPNVKTYWLALDIETLHSADDCRVCLTPWENHDPQTSECLAGSWHEQHASPMRTYHKIGWDNKAALGLSIGCYWDSLDQRIHFFDVTNLAETMQRLVDEQPLIVGFNSAAFDLPLLRGILRRRAETLWETAQAHPDHDEAREWKNTSAALTALCDAFKVLCASSYDILTECWRADPLKKKVKGLHTLGALAEANGYGGKTGDGAQAPRDWAAGRIASVVNYNMNDVYLTKALFDKIQRGEPLLRSDGSALMLPKAGGVA